VSWSGGTNNRRALARQQQASGDNTPLCAGSALQPYVTIRQNTPHWLVGQRLETEEVGFVRSWRPVSCSPCPARLYLRRTDLTARRRDKAGRASSPNLQYVFTVPRYDRWPTLHPPGYLTVVDELGNVDYWHFVGDNPHVCCLLACLPPCGIVAACGGTCWMELCRAVANDAWPCGLGADSWGCGTAAGLLCMG
jgi:hypothetical protein